MAAKQSEFGKGENVRKPFKVSGKNKEFRGVVASTLEELKSLACKFLQIPLAHEAKVYLDEDWTAVDNEEYFQFLPAQTKLIVLQQWEEPNFGIDIGIYIYYRIFSPVTMQSRMQYHILIIIKEWLCIQEKNPNFISQFSIVIEK